MFYVLIEITIYSLLNTLLFDLKIGSVHNIDIKTIKLICSVGIYV